jgi:hypothetical protein
LGERRASTLKEARKAKVNTIFMVNAIIFSQERSGIMRLRKNNLDDCSSRQIIGVLGPTAFLEEHPPWVRMKCPKLGKKIQQD